MFTGIVGFLVDLLIVGLVIWAISWFIGILDLPPQIKQIVLVIVAVIGLLWLISLLPALGVLPR